VLTTLPPYGGAELAEALSAIGYQSVASDGIEHPSDARAMQLASQLDEPEKKALIEEALMAKWSRVPDRGGKVHDWLGQESEDKGFPKLRNRSERLKMAMILENQLTFQKKRRLPVVNGYVHITQDTTTSDEALPTKYALPIIRRQYALMQRADFQTVQPLPGPSAFLFWLDFIRESDNTNILSIEYNPFLVGEAQVPPKGKMVLNRQLIGVVKQLMGVPFTVEAQEDLQNQLGMDVEQELINAFTTEFGRNTFGRHLQQILVAAQTGTNVGQNLGAPWLGPNPSVAIPAPSGQASADRKASIYNAVIDADLNFRRANRLPSNGILAGLGLAAFLEKVNIAASSRNPGDDLMNALGISDYGTYMARWQIWGTDFLPDNVGFLYRRDADTLRASFIYAPYVPVTVMPAIYGDYDPVTGNYQNKDVWTRNIRERSASLVTRSYGFMPITGPAGLAF
jgi:hypothetical protein